MKIVICILIMVLVACGKSQSPITDDQKKRKAEIAEQEIKDFEKCMRLAAENSRLGDDDVSQIIIQCRKWSESQALGKLLAEGLI